MCEVGGASWLQIAVDTSSSSLPLLSPPYSAALRMTSGQTAYVKSSAGRGLYGTFTAELNHTPWVRVLTGGSRLRQPALYFWLRFPHILNGTVTLSPTGNDGGLRLSWVPCPLCTWQNVAQRTPATLSLHLSTSSPNSPTLVLDLITSVPRAVL